MCRSNPLPCTPRPCKGGPTLTRGFEWRELRCALLDRRQDSSGGGLDGPKPKRARITQPGLRRRRQSGGASGARQRSPEEQDEIDMLKQQVMELQKHLLSKAAAPPTKRKRAPPKPKNLTQDEKQLLSQQIKMLPGEKLTKVLKIISEKMPISHNNDQDEIVVDMEALDTATLRELQKYVKQQMSARNKRNRQNTAQMQQLAQKMQEHTAARIQALEKNRSTAGSDSSSEDSSGFDSDSGSEEVIEMNNSRSESTFW